MSCLRDTVEYQVFSHPDKVNNVYKILALIMDQDTETTPKLLNIFKENTRESLKSIIYNI